jgi:hypothetical protein
MPPETINDFFSPVSTDIAHQNIDELIALNTLKDAGSISAADPLWNKYIQGAEAVGDWLVEKFPPTSGRVEKGTPEYEQAEQNIRRLFGFIPQEKWEIPLIGLGAAGSAGRLGKKGLSKLHKTAKNVFGTTDNLKSTRFILDDGSYLDFSGSLKKHRYFNEDDIRMIGDETSWGGYMGRTSNPGSKQFSGMDRHKFVESGAINWRHEKNALRIGAKPSDDQLNTLKKIFKKVSGRTKDEQWLATGSVAPIMRIHMQDIKNIREAEATLNLESIKWKDIEEMLNNFYSGKELGGIRGDLIDNLIP